MFTGIIEGMGTVLALEPEASNLHLTVQASFTSELKVDQSLAHDGVCLTVVQLVSLTSYKVTAVQETLNRTTLANVTLGQQLNLERCLQLGSRLDGHWVQGHVEGVGKVEGLDEKGGSWELAFSYPPQFDALLVPKGSICVNGVSLTVVAVGSGYFSVAIIPYTYTHTNLGSLQPGAPVNLEFDVLGKYVQRQLALRQ